MESVRDLELIEKIALAPEPEQKERQELWHKVAETSPAQGNLEEKLEEKTQNMDGFCLTILACLPDMAMLDDRALARALGVCKRTVRRMATRHELPPPIRQAGKSLWIAGKVRAWISERAEQAEQKARKELARR
jgi:predicted DNA-binding transcriptional regulator AlpA